MKKQILIAWLLLGISTAFGQQLHPIYIETRLTADYLEPRFTSVELTMPLARLSNADFLRSVEVSAFYFADRPYFVPANVYEFGGELGLSFGVFRGWTSRFSGGPVMQVVGGQPSLFIESDASLQGKLAEFLEFGVALHMDFWSDTFGGTIRIPFTFLLGDHFYLAVRPGWSVYAVLPSFLWFNGIRSDLALGVRL